MTVIKRVIIVVVIIISNSSGSSSILFESVMSAAGFCDCGLHVVHIRAIAVRSWTKSYVWFGHRCG